MVAFTPESNFGELVRNFSLINFQYAVLRTSLKYSPNNAARALQVSQILIQIYSSYFKDLGEVARLKKEQAEYRTLLNIEPIPSQPESFPPTLSSHIRYVTTTFNWPRLLAVRGRRLLLSTAPLLQNVSSYQRALQTVDMYARPINQYLAWIFFLPRVLDNLLDLLNHIISKPSDLRLHLQTWVNRRGFEFANDLLLLFAGVMICFAVTTQLASIQVMLITQCCDLLLCVARAIIEINRMHHFDAENDKSLKTAFRECLAYESERLHFNIVNSGVLLLSFALLSVAAYPLLQVLGATLALVMTIIAFKKSQHLEQTKPSVLANSFFKQPTESDDNICASNCLPNGTICEIF